MAGGERNGISSLPPPRPKSPPQYPDLYGKRRELARVQMLEREVGCLQEELKFFDGLPPASQPCKEVADFVMAKADPLIVTAKKRRRRCRFWKWFCGLSCFKISCLSCCCRCSPSCCWCSPSCKMPSCCEDCNCSGSVCSPGCGDCNNCSGCVCSPSCGDCNNCSGCVCSPSCGDCNNCSGCVCSPSCKMPSCCRDCNCSGFQSCCRCSMPKCHCCSLRPCGCFKTCKCGLNCCIPKCLSSSNCSSKCSSSCCLSCPKVKFCCSCTKNCFYPCFCLF